MSNLKPHALRVIRVRSKLSCTDVAAKLGVSSQAVSQWERGAYPIADKWVALILDVCGATPKDLEDEIHRLNLRNQQSEVSP